MIEEQIDVPGASLWTASQGAGVPLVLCHGGPGLSDNLEAVAEMVDDLALVHRYDQRGSGRSRSDGPFDVARSSPTSKRSVDIGATSAGWSAGTRGARTSICATR